MSIPIQPSLPQKTQDYGGISDADYAALMETVRKMDNKEGGGLPAAAVHSQPEFQIEMDNASYAAMVVNFNEKHKKKGSSQSTAADPWQNSILSLDINTAIATKTLIQFIKKQEEADRKAVVVTDTTVQTVSPQAGITYTGNMRYGVLHGQGRVTIECQKSEDIDAYTLVVDGIFNNGKLIRGTTQCLRYKDSSYAGDLISYYGRYVPHGHGTYRYNSNHIYRGDVNYGRRIGQGNWYENGRLKYKGEWMNGCYHGKGTIRIPQGIIDGEFVNGRLVKGTTQRCNFEDGHYKGEIREFIPGEFLPHGFGTKNYLKNGAIYEGNWFKGKRWGDGKLTENGAVFEGFFKWDRLKRDREAEKLRKQEMQEKGMAFYEGPSNMTMLQRDVSERFIKLAIEAFYDIELIYLLKGVFSGERDKLYRAKLVEVYSKAYSIDKSLCKMHLKRIFKWSWKDYKGSPVQRYNEVEAELKNIGITGQDALDSFGSTYNKKPATAASAAVPQRNSTIVDAQYENGKLIKGKTTCMMFGDRIYEGDIIEHNGKYIAHGFGIYRYHTGYRYEGNVEYEKRMGQGSYYYNNQLLYRGEWKNVQHGRGTVITSKGSIDGEFYNGRLVKGVTQKFTSEEGVYVGGIGEFNKEYLPNGFGAMRYKDGTVYVGNWLNGQRSGEGKFTDHDGTTIVGHFKTNYLVASNQSSQSSTAASVASLSSAASAESAVATVNVAEVDAKKKADSSG